MSTPTISRMPERSSDSHFVGWIEAKETDLVRIHDLLSPSRELNWWANFGPVVTRLESEISRWLGLDHDYTAITCSSGTAALETLAKAEAVKAGHRLRWVASSLSYFNVRSGFFAGTRLIDCTESGILSIPALESLPSSEFDGVIVTNPYGYEFPEDYVTHVLDWCAARSKPVLFDNAAGMGLSRPLRRVRAAYSFHQTKAFGMGEGGAFTLPRDDKDLARSLINFGKGKGGMPAARAQDLDRLATNAKLSEIAAAPILDRLLTVPDWVPKYSTQAARVTRLARSMNLQLLPGFDPYSQVANSVPMLLPTAAPLPPSSRAMPLQLGRYFEPLDGVGSNALDLFGRLALVPAHAGLASLADDQLAQALRSLRESC